MTEGLQISQQTKEKLFAKKMKCPSQLNIDKFKSYNTLYNKLRHVAKKFYYNDQFKRFAQNSKQTWSVIREKQKDYITLVFQ